MTDFDSWRLARENANRLLRQLEGTPQAEPDRHPAQSTGAPGPACWRSLAVAAGAFRAAASWLLGAG